MATSARRSPTAKRVPIVEAKTRVIASIAKGNTREKAMADVGRSLETYKSFPDTADLYGVNPEHGTRGVEQSTRWSATRNVVFSRDVGAPGRRARKSRTALRRDAAQRRRARD